MRKITLVMNLSTVILLLFILSSCFGPMSFDFNNNLRGPSGEVVFISDRNRLQNFQVYLAKIDGSEITYIPTTEDSKVAVASSFDTNMLAFIDQSADANQSSKPILVGTAIYSFNRATQQLVQLDDYPEGSMGYQINMSGDGRKVVYMVRNGDTDAWSPYGINSDGTGRHLIFEEEGYNAGYASLNYDGSKVAFMVQEQNEPSPASKQIQEGIYEANWDGSNPVLLIENSDENIVNTMPIYSPDDTKIAFVFANEGDETCQIKVYDRIHGGEPISLCDMEGIIWGLRYNTDGTRICFAPLVIIIPDIFKLNSFDNSGLSNKNGTINLFSIDAITGGDIRSVTTGGDMNLFWRFLKVIAG